MRRARPEAYAFAPPSWILPDHYTEFLLACKVACSHPPASITTVHLPPHSHPACNLEPCLDAFSLRSDVIRSVEILSCKHKVLPTTAPDEESLIELMTPDRKIKASIEGS